MKVKNRVASVHVVADDSAVVSRVGAALVSQLADRVGLTQAWSAAMAPTRSRDRGHDPGHVLRDLAVMLADGGEFVSDIATLREQPALFGQVASPTTAWRCVRSVDSNVLARLRAARARTRQRVWKRTGISTLTIVDVDCTMITSHSDAKEGAAGTFKGGFGFHPVLAFLDATGEALASILRPGNASAWSASDLNDCVDLALDQLTDDMRRGALIRGDSACASSEFIDHVVGQGCRFSVSFPVRFLLSQIGDLAPAAWQPAVDSDGEPVEFAQVAEVPTSALSKHMREKWPEGSRFIVRRERAHAGAQLTMLDHEGNRLQIVFTNQPDADIAMLDARHRMRGRCEQQIEQLQQTGLAKLPFGSFAANQTWCELALAAHDLLIWTRRLLLDDEFANVQVKRLRYCILHAAGRLTRHARRLTLHLPRRWPWTIPIERAHQRLAALAV